MLTAWLDYLRSRHAAIVAPAVDGVPETSARIVGFGDPYRELAAADRGAVACPLPDWTALTVAGPDATAFLHGQFTNDVAGLAVGAVQVNGYCSPKGRMLATFPLARTADAEYLLAVPADIAPALVRRLRMFVLRSKVVVMPLADTHVCIGSAGTAGTGSAGPPAVRVETDATVLGLPDGRTLTVCPAAMAPACWERATRAATPAGAPVWDWLAIRAGVPVVTAATQDKFVPQMLNFELIGGVNFQKGCYPGQEIVARMQYLGRLKERLYRAHVGGTETVAAGTSLFGAQFGDQACGTIVNAAPAPGGGHDVLAVIQTASAQSDSIRLAHAADAPVLALLPLPYTVPAPQAR